VGRCLAVVALLTAVLTAAPAPSAIAATPVPAPTGLTATATSAREVLLTWNHHAARGSGGIVAGDR
jgi:hypothetical protein